MAIRPHAFTTLVLCNFRLASFFQRAHIEICALLGVEASTARVRFQLSSFRAALVASKSISAEKPVERGGRLFISEDHARNRARKTRPELGPVSQHRAETSIERKPWPRIHRAARDRCS